MDSQQPAAGVTVVPLGPDDRDRLLGVDAAAFFFDPSQHDVAHVLDYFEWPQTFGASRDGGSTLCGVYTAFSLGLTVPGPLDALTTVPMPGLSWVSVHPDHRRRGVLRAMLGHHFAQLHEQGEGISGLHAAEPAIYGRFGYAVASLEVHLSMGRGATFTAPALGDEAGRLETRFMPMDSDEARARVHRLHVAATASTLGAVTRSELMGRVLFRDHPPARVGREPQQVMFCTRDGEATGYARFTRSGTWEDGSPKGTVAVTEVAALDEASLLALARRLVDFDLTTRVTFDQRSTDDPLLWWAGGPRAVDISTYDGLWLRLVDVGRALSERGYAATCDVVIEVVDEVCPWNQRRWRLSVDDKGVGRCSPTTDPADLRLPVQALGAAYLGSRSIASQAHRGVVEERRTGAVRQLSMAMRADREPMPGIAF